MCTQYGGFTLAPWGLPKKSESRLTDRLDMTFIGTWVDLDIEPQNKQTRTIIIVTGQKKLFKWQTNNMSFDKCDYQMTIWS